MAGGKKLERLRAVGRFFMDRGWWTENWALKLRRPKITQAPTIRPGQENARRLPAFVLFARYSGLRIGDAASCDVSRLAGSRLLLYTQKTGVQVYIPLPTFVVEVLAACPRISERYWFWTGVGTKETLSGNWRRTFYRLCELAGVRGGHPQRFRDTLAVELLLEGVPIERVSILLGHSSVRITEKHYAPWVRAWRNDPIAQAEMLGDTAQQDTPAPQMVATYPRHEKDVAPD